MHDEIEGWFDFDDVYDDAANAANNGSILVEVGVWQGKSLFHLAAKLLHQNKFPKLYGVDTWAGSDEIPHKAYLEQIGGPDAFYNQFIGNCQRYGYDKLIIPLKMTSVEAAATFEDKTIDFVYIDASHEYKDVLADILAWMPKVRKDGVIGGHDWPWAPVHTAVKEIFGENITIRRNSWLHQI